MPPNKAPTLRETAAKLAETMQCNCDLDRWQPEDSTGHSRVCRIHKAANAEHVADAIEMACCGDPGCRCETCPEQRRANALRRGVPALS